MRPYRLPEGQFKVHPRKRRLGLRPKQNLEQSLKLKLKLQSGPNLLIQDTSSAKKIIGIIELWAHIFIGPVPPLGSFGKPVILMIAR